MAQDSVKILLVEDNPGDARLVEEMLAEASRGDGNPLYRLTVAGRLDEALERLDDERFDLILLDLSLPDSQGLDTVRRTLAAAGDLPVVVMSGLGDREMALAAVKAGAQDYLVKGRLNEFSLSRAIHYAIERKETERALREREALLRQVLDTSPSCIFVKDEAGRYVVVNEGIARLYGATADEMVGRTDLDLVEVTGIRTEDAERFMADDQQVITSGETVFISEEPFAQPDGSRQWFQTVKVPMTSDNSGRHVLGVATEITARKEIEDTLARRVRQLALLADVGREITSVRGLSGVLNKAARLIHERFGFHHVGLFTLAPARGELVMRASASDFAPILGQDHAVRLGQGLVGWVGRHGETRICNDVEADPQYINFYPDVIPTRSELCVPLRSGGEVVGVLDVQSPHPDAFDAEDVRVMEILADQVSVAIENARLFQAEREHRQLAEALHQAAAAVGGTLDLDRVFDLILAQVKRVVPCDSASIMLVEDGRARIVRWRGYNGNPRDPAADSFDVADTPTLRHMFETQGPILVPNTEEFPGWIDRSEQSQSYAGAPIYVRGEVLGFLNVNSTTSGRFRQVHVGRLMAFADQASLAIQNARLYKEARQRNRELALLNRVMAASAAFRDLESILDVVCRELALAFDLPRATGHLYDKGKSQATIVAEYRAEGQASVLGRTIPVADVPASQHIWERRAPLVVEDVQHDPHLAPVRNLLHQYGVTSLLLLPLTVNQEVVGSVALLSSQPRRFTDEEVEVAQRVVDQVSGALARARLEEDRGRLTTAVERSAEGIIVTDTDGLMLYVNPAFEQITGYRQVEVLGLSLEMLRDEGPAPGLQENMAATLQTGQAWQGRINSRKKDGSRFIADATISPVGQEAGDGTSYVVTIRDVTREVQLEEQVQQSQKMEALGRLAGGVAHDFNNLLTVVHLSTRLLERNLEPKDPLHRHVERIQDAGRRATDLTKQLLSFSRQEVIRPRRLDLNEAVGEMNKMLRRIIGEDVELVTQLDEALWPVHMDPTQVDQVVMNLAVNARDAMPQGGSLCIETANVVLDEAYAAQHVEAEPGEYVMLAMSDTGVGMSDEVQARIFEPFFTTKDPSKGTGLGLATVFGIVKQNEGHIWVYSEVGQGTTFKIYLPRAAHDAQDGTKPPAEARGPGHDGTLRGTETILLVEDEETVRDLAVQTLRLYGYKVLVAADGAKALEIGGRQDGDIDLLLTDIVMPQMSGQEVLSRLRAHQPDLRVLFMSGYAGEALAHHGRPDSDAAFLSKPFSLDELLRQVRAALDAEV